jgi:hypothetical protein
MGHRIQPLHDAHKASCPSLQSPPTIWKSSLLIVIVFVVNHGLLPLYALTVNEVEHDPDHIA